MNESFQEESLGLVDADKIHDCEFYLFDGLKYNFYDFIKNVKEACNKSCNKLESEQVDDAFFILEKVKKINKHMKEFEDLIKSVNREVDYFIVNDRRFSFAPGAERAERTRNGNEEIRSPLLNMFGVRTPPPPVLPEEPYTISLQQRQDQVVPERPSTNPPPRPTRPTVRQLNIHDDPRVNRILNELLPSILSYQIYSNRENGNTQTETTTAATTTTASSREREE